MRSSALASITILPLGASTVLIDGTTRNGAFSTLIPGGIEGSQVPFVETANWTNIGTTSQAAQAIRNLPANLNSLGIYPGASGGYNAVVTDNDTRRFGNDTGYIVNAGDTFDFNYHWIDAFNWDDETDQIALRFFTTSNNDILGTEVDSFVLLSGPSTINATYEQVTQTGVSLPASFNGDRLFIAFYGLDGNGTSGAFARVDDFSLSVIPEPSTSVLACLATVALIRRRRLSG